MGTLCTVEGTIAVGDGRRIDPATFYGPESLLRCLLTQLAINCSTRGPVRLVPRSAKVDYGGVPVRVVGKIDQLGLFDRALCSREQTYSMPS